MSKNPITAIIFDEDTFILSQHYRRYEGYDEGDKIVFYAFDKEPYPDDFTTPLEGQERAFVPDLPDGEYNLIAKIKDGRDRFKVEFSLFNVDTGTVEGTAILDAKDYLESFHDVFNTASGASTLDEAERLEKAFSVRYLKNAFGSLIEGNDSFWTRLFRDLDVATVPLNIQISRDLNGQRQKPIEVRQALS